MKLSEKRIIEAVLTKICPTQRELEELPPKIPPIETSWNTWADIKESLEARRTAAFTTESAAPTIHWYNRRRYARRAISDLMWLLEYGYRVFFVDVTSPYGKFVYITLLKLKRFGMKFTLYEFERECSMEKWHSSLKFDEQEYKDLLNHHLTVVVEPDALLVNKVLLPEYVQARMQKRS